MHSKKLHVDAGIPKGAANHSWGRRSLSGSAKAAEDRTKTEGRGQRAEGIRWDSKTCARNLETATMWGALPTGDSGCTACVVVLY